MVLRRISTRIESSYLAQHKLTLCLKRFNMIIFQRWVMDPRIHTSMIQITRIEPEPTQSH